MNNVKWIIAILAIILIINDASASDKSLTYGHNIRKIEKLIFEVEEHAMVFGLASASEKYPGCFSRSFGDAYSIYRHEFFETGYTIKFEPVECGEIKENKYIKFKIWRKKWTFGDLVSKAREFEDFNFFDSQYMVCNNDFSEVKGTYDSLNTFRTNTRIKQLAKKCSNVGFYSMLSNKPVFIRNLDSGEICLLIESLGKIKYNLFDHYIDPGYLLMKDCYLCLRMECDNSYYEIFIEEGDISRKRLIDLKDFNIIAKYDYCNILFFKLTLELLILNKISYLHMLYPEDNSGLGYPDYLFRELSPEIQKLICGSKRNFYSSVGESECLKTDTTQEITIKYKAALSKYFDTAADYESYPGPLRNCHILFPHCPSNNSQKYSYFFEPGSVELRCPTHGATKKTLK